LEDTVKKYEILEYFRFNSEVTSCIWDDKNYLWKIYLNNNNNFITSNFLISATGQLNIPNIPGLI
jgi:cation diffusion facilitator CzcD-associated flavoprotein CzcO